MTVQAETSVVNYEGDGVTTVFPFNYRILQPSDVQVIVNNVVLSVGFTTTMNADQGNQPGGEVTMDFAPSNGIPIVLYRFILPNQEIDYTAYDSFPAETHELGLDKLTMLVQQDTQLINNAIHFQLNESPEEVNTLLPPPAERANRFMYFDGSGNLIMFDAIVSQPGILRIDVHADSQTMARFNYPSTPEFPELELLYNGPLGTVKLNEQGKIPEELLDFVGLRMLGPYRGDDLCPKLGDTGGECIAPDTRNPSQRFPEAIETFEAGDYFALTFLPPEVDGTMELFAEIGATQTSIVQVLPQDAIIFISEIIDPDPPNDILVHEGWYHLPALLQTSSAIFVSYDDTGNTYVLGANVQIALDATDIALIQVDQSLMTQKGQTRTAYVLTDANLAMASGHYQMDINALNTPIPGQSWTVTSIYSSPTRIVQLAVGISPPNSTFTRVFNDTWADWIRLVQGDEIADAEDRLDVVEAETDDNTAAIIENTSDISDNTSAISLKKDNTDFLLSGTRLDISNVPTS